MLDINREFLGLHRPGTLHFLFSDHPLTTKSSSPMFYVCVDQKTHPLLQPNTEFSDHLPETGTLIEVDESLGLESLGGGIEVLYYLGGEDEEISVNLDHHEVLSYYRQQPSSSRCQCYLANASSRVVLPLELRIT